jgi:hypothetical protein
LPGIWLTVIQLRIKICVWYWDYVWYWKLRTFLLIISGNILKFNCLSSHNTFYVQYCYFIFPQNKVKYNQKRFLQRPFRSFLHLNTFLCVLSTFAMHKDRFKIQPLKQREFPCISCIRITHTTQDFRQALKKFIRWLEEILIKTNRFLLCHITIRLTLRDLIPPIRFYDEFKSKNSSLLNFCLVFLLPPWNAQIDCSISCSRKTSAYTQSLLLPD